MIKKKKTVSKLGIERNFLSLVKNTYKPIGNITLNGKKLVAFWLRLGAKQGYSFSFNIVFETLANTIRQENKIKGIPVRNKENWFCLQMIQSSMWKI